MKPLHCFFATMALAALAWEGCQTPTGRVIAPQTDTVYISGMKFRPEVLRVNKSDTVIWINQDLVKHNVTAYPGEKWTSGPIPPDSSWRRVVSDTFNYFCSIHPTMKGQVKLKAP